VKLVALGVLLHTLGPTSRVTLLAHQLAFESLAIGAFGAVLVFRGARVLRLLYHPVGQLATVAGFVAVIYAFDDVMIRSPTFGTASISLVFLAVILNVGCNERSLLRIGNPVLDYLGRISYGIYMFHPLVIYGIVYAVWRLGWDPVHHVAMQGALYAAAAGGTIGVAALSYRYFETPFLRLKKRFAHVESGGDAIPVGGFAGAPAMATQRVS
jgi:peptidoglycan/LPS O-acetylase OafA/YrhL